jgi:hypothetical protein
MLPSSIFRTVVGPLKFYQFYDLIPKNFKFSVQYVHRLDLKVSFWLHLNHIPINNMVRIMYIIFKGKRHEIHYAHSWKQIMQACMQLALFYPMSQMDHKIWLLALYNYPTSMSSSWASPSKAHALPL